MLARFPRPMPKVFTAVALLFIFSFATTHAGSSQRSHLLTNQSSPDLAPEVVTITATKTDTLVDDVNSNTLVDPGDTLEYSIELSNSGDENALNTLFTDITDDTEVTVVAGSLTATPIGVNDSYNVIGNTHITLLAAGGLLLNDIDPDGGALTASCAPCTTTQGSTVTLNTDGSFTYTPPAGYTGSDTFIYTVTDPDGLTDTGTVTFTITNRIWWVDSNAPGGGDGRSTSPFNTISAAQTASAINDIIFIYNRGANYTDGFVLKNGQRLCGHGSNLQSCSGITPPTGTTFPAVATNPTIINAAGAGITLAQNNTIYGITIGSTTGFGITGTNFGTLTGQNLTINTSSGALSLTTGTANVTFNAITSSGGVNNINLGSVGGTLNLGSGALSGSTSHAFLVNGGSATISYIGTIGNSTADAVNIQSKTGGIVSLSGAVTSTGTGISLSSNTGATINFTGGIALTTTGNEAFTAAGGGTFSVTGSNNTINATNATALNVANTTIGAGNLNFLRISSSGAARGITLNNTGTSGGLTVTGTGATDGSGGTISTITQRGIELITTRNISLANMTLTNANTANGAVSDGTLGGNENTDEHGAIYLQSVVNVNLTNVDINGAVQHGINGNTVTNLDISNSLIQNTGNAVWESGIYIFHLFGLPSASADNVFNNITVQDTGQFNIFVQNGSPTNAAPGEMDRLTFSNSTFSDSGNSVPGDHITVANRNNANFHTVVTNATFTAVVGQTSDSIQIDAGNTSRSDIDISGSSFSNGNIAINISGSGTSLTTFEVENNPSVTNRAGNTVNIASNGSAALQGHITNNTISTVVANNAGFGIDIVVDQTGSAIVDINNNTITGQSTGIRAGARNAGTGTADITIRNNTVTTGGSFPFSGVYLFAGNGSGGESNNVCVNFSANTVDTTSAFDSDYFLEQYTGNTFRLQGLAPPAGATEAQVEAFIASTDLDPSPTDPTVEAFGGTVVNYIAGTCAVSPVSAPEADTSEADEAEAVNEQPETAVDKNIVNDTPITTMPTDEVPVSPTDEESVPGTVVEESAPETVDSETAVSLTTPLPTGEIVNRAGSDSIAADKDQPDELSPETIEATTTVGPFTLPPGESTTITFQVMVNDPFPAANNPICNQATISGSNFANVLTDDPDTGAPADPTCTTVEINADLAITKTDGAATEIPGTVVTYTIVATNAGPNPDPAAIVADTFPAAITSVTWTCLGAGGATCTAAGSGNINETVNLPVGGSVTFTASGTISPAATGTLANTAAVATSVGITDPNLANNSATDTDTLTPQADVSITKTDGQTTAVPGTTIVYTIAAANAGPSDAPGVTVADTFPVVLTGVTWTCAGAGGGTCTAAGAGNINDIANLPAGGSVTYTVNATISAAATGTLVNTATATVPGGVTDPAPGNNSATDTDTLTPQADVSLTKTDGQTTAVPGTAIVYTIVAANAGPSNAPDVTVTDTFSATLTGVTWSCAGVSGGTCTAAGAGDINDTANLPAGGSVTYTVNAIIAANASGTLINTATATVSGGVTDPDPGNNSATDTSTLTPQVDLSITKTDGQATAVPGTTITYTIVAANAGPSNAPGTTIADTFVAVLTGVTWTCTGAGGGTCTAAGAGDINDAANLPAGGSVTYTVNATISPDATGTLVNTATATGSGSITDPVPGNNSATDTNSLTPQADVAITKTDGQTTAIPGTTITYTIVVSNSGPSNAPTVTITDTFPTTLLGVTWTCAGAGGGTCTAAGTGDINDMANLPAGSSVTYTLNATISGAATGTLSNTATAAVGGGVTDPAPANNSATDTTTLTPEADLSITKTDGPDPILAGSTLLYTVTVTNNGPSPAQGVVVTDTLPAGVTLVATSGCLGDPAGVPTCTLGDIPALNSAQFTIEVTVDIGTSGTITNTADVSSSTPDPNIGNNTASALTTLLEIDFGDAPDPTYPTLLASNGARHLITGPFLGTSVDGEDDGQPNATATGDDGDGNDDEDGVTIPGALVTGSTAAVDVVASAACTLSAWVDFNGDGDWADAGEDISPGGVVLAAGNNSLTFPVPAGATLGTTFARFRCTTAGAVSFTGLAADGEVEDYQVEIVDNQFSIGDVTALEGNSSDTLFMFTVTRTTNSTAASVAYATSDSSAVAGLDYTAVPSTTINFSAGGSLTQTAVVTVTGDLMFEPDETFTVTLSTPVNGDISDGEASGTILNEDAPPALTVASVTNFETAGTFPFTVTLSVVSGQDASVSYSTSDGTAAAGSDYTATSGSLTIPAGSATGVISVTVLDDALPESTETFTLTLSSPVSATIGSGTAVGTIIDDENPPNIISVTDVTAGEAAGLVTFTLSLDTVSGSDVLVDYASNDGPAAAGQDYTAVAGTLTIATGTLSNTVSVPILDDNLDEMTETFTLDLSNAVNAVIIDAQGISTILDDDESPIATNDAYTTTEDTALTVPAPGLLANDSDGDGDGLTAVLTTPPTNGAISLNADGSFTYTPTLNFSGSDSFTYQANDGANNSNTADVTITVLSTEDPGLIYLPIIFNNHVQLPDLVVEEINVLPGGEIEVVITNQGQAPVGDNFWVDLYINPDPLPTAVNQIWTQLADEGLVWGVDDLAALTPGGTLVLSSQDADAQYSNYSGSLASGTVIAVQVDSADVETDFGGVLEEHESLGEPYNNILVVTVE
jgi:uncharacterized repeat protein (TIGR01451 family)